MKKWIKIADKALLCLIAIVLLVPLVIVVIIPVYNIVFAIEIARYDSPDGRHVVILKNVPGHIGHPGSSNEAPGYVILEDSDGNRLQRMKIDMIKQLVSIHWDPKQVIINDTTQWPR